MTADETNGQVNRCLNGAETQAEGIRGTKRNDQDQDKGLKAEENKNIGPGELNNEKLGLKRHKNTEHKTKDHNTTK